IAQMIAGAFIGIGIKKEDLIRLRLILKPSILILASMLILNIFLGYFIHKTSNIDLLTSLMSAVPGGLTNTPVISAEMGADVSVVAVMQIIRFLLGIGLLPIIIKKSTATDKVKMVRDPMQYYNNIGINNLNYAKVVNTIVTISIAAGCGIIGKTLGIPAGTITFSMIGVIVLKLSTNYAYMPYRLKYMAQLLAGAYIGTKIGLNDVLKMKYLLVPIIMLIIGYSSLTILMGKLLNRRFNMGLKESLLATIPAGATDIALIASDIGIDGPDVIVLQIIRMIFATSIIPQIIHFLSKLA
ncbi:MAG: membrane-spanning protein, partial [Firmicutes bacterium]|nr:membrane-spanning protein [Bacillota bacterium]